MLSVVEEVTQDRTLRLSLAVVVERDGEDYHAFSPALRGLHVFGATEDEALANATDAVRVYLDSLIRAGESLPVGPFPAVLHHGSMAEIPDGALLRHVELQWPFHNTSGIS